MIGIELARNRCANEISARIDIFYFVMDRLVGGRYISFWETEGGDTIRAFSDDILKNKPSIHLELLTMKPFNFNNKKNL